MTQSLWPQHEDTQHLLASIRDGDEQAMEHLLARYRDSLHRLVGGRIDPKILRRTDVSDVVQEVLVEASRRIPEYVANPILPFHLWIRQIAKDRIIDSYRRHRGSAKRSLDREQPLDVPQKYVDQSSLDIAAQLKDPELTPAAMLVQKELAAHVQARMELLEERDREILLMRHFEQLGNQEIALALGISEPAASMRYLRALKKLRALIEQ
ncbi:MAG: sigma-70 family RNA polymerase sigma factor [Planctomycetales bacterium]|nr:sigma-70 family RNA polymerase sigma factor [Planctomycetales bacterium]